MTTKNQKNCLTAQTSSTHSESRQDSAPLHTPGPWEVSDWMILCDKINKFGNFYVAEIHPQFAKESEGEALQQAEANARLIAAAPELLEACKAVVTAHTLSNSERSRIGMKLLQPNPATLLCSVAISKAEGKDVERGN